MEILLARSAEQEMYSDDGVWWWKEWRLRSVTSDQYYRLRIDRPYQPWLLEERYLCRLPVTGKVIGKPRNGENLQGAVIRDRPIDEAWSPWWMDRSPRETIMHMLGDSSFLEATSLHEEHAACVQVVRGMRALNDDLYKTEKCYESAVESYDQTKRDEERQFFKRHGDKTGDAFEKAKKRTLARVKPLIDHLRKEVCEWADRVKAAKEAVAKGKIDYKAFADEEVSFEPAAAS